jgi:hypothetical protein
MEIAVIFRALVSYTFLNKSDFSEVRAPKTTLASNLGVVDFCSSETKHDRRTAL